MRRYLKYLSYVLRHKWFVFLECCNRGLVWRGLIHDLSKLFPSEFIPYAKFFYNKDGTKKQVRDKTGYYKPHDTGDSDFDFAWFLHQKRNNHHWQYHILPKDITGVRIFPMGEESTLEMICDWKGASRAQGVSSGSVLEWYEKNKGKI